MSIFCIRRLLCKYIFVNYNVFIFCWQWHWFDSQGSNWQSVFIQVMACGTYAISHYLNLTSTITTYAVNRFRHLRNFILMGEIHLISNHKSDKQCWSFILLAKWGNMSYIIPITWTDFAQYSNHFSLCQFIRHGNEYISSDTHVCHPYRNMRCVWINLFYKANLQNKSQALDHHCVHPLVAGGSSPCLGELY